MSVKTKKQSKSATHLQHICYKSVPLLQKFRGYLKKDVANLPQIWMPIETNLLNLYEFATLSPQTRYVFVAIVLYCGMRGVDEIPIDIAFLSNALAVDGRLLKKSLEELEFCGLLLEREKERIEKEQTDRKKEGASARVPVDGENQPENGSKNQSEEAGQNVIGGSTTSEFTLEECRRYVEEETKNGSTISNPNALAMSMYKTGSSDSFIKARLYPEQAELEQYGEPIEFSDNPCSVCFGAKQADIGDNRFGKCLHCKNEKGQPTGSEPITV